MTATMRALRAHGLIGPPGLWVDEIKVPTRPAEDAVRIDVHAAGVGFVDTLVTRGKYQVRQEPPFVPGMEVAGVVADRTGRFRSHVGQRVIGSVPVGGCAETVWAPAASGCVHWPRLLTFTEGAAMVVNYHTALVALAAGPDFAPASGSRARRRSAVSAAAACRIAVALGADVIAVAGSSERRALATAAGRTGCTTRTDGSTPFGRSGEST